MSSTNGDRAAAARGLAAGLTRRAKSAVVRKLAELPPVQEAARSASPPAAPAATPAGDGPTYAELLNFYERVRARFVPQRLPSIHTSMPSAADLDDVATVARRVENVYRAFFRTAVEAGSFDDAVIQSTRSMIDNDFWGQARSFAQVLQCHDELVPISDISLAMGAEIAPLPLTVRDYLHRNDLEYVLWHVADLYFRSGFELDPAASAATLRRVLDGELPTRPDAYMWLDIAVSAFAAREEALAGRALERAEAKIADRPDGPATHVLQLRSAALRRFVERDQGAPRVPAQTVSIGVLAYRHPDRRRASKSLAEPLQTLAGFGHVLRQRNVSFTGDPDLATFADDAREAVPESRRVDGPHASVALYPVDRDVAYCAGVPDGTWIIWSGDYAEPVQGPMLAAPHPALRPIYVGLDIDYSRLAKPGVIEHLRAHAPIGCQNWDTVYLLLGADVPAFFSGTVAATLDVSTELARTPGTLVVDARPGRDHLTLDTPGQPERHPAEMLRKAQAAAVEIRRAQQVRTHDLTAYFVARGMGVDTDLDPVPLASPQHSSLVALDDVTFRAVHDSLTQKLAAVVGAIVSGADSESVYATWASVCADDVAQARARLAAGSTWPSLSFDPELISDAIRAASVTVERSDSASVAGEEVNVEFSLDGNYKHQLDVVLDSVVSRTTRPIRAFILCRDHGPDDFDRMARLFPTVSFVWLPTDDVVYGPIAGKVPWASFATMDRTLLPLIAPQIDRILHLDLDLMVLGDLGELFDWKLGDRPLAAIVEAQNRFRSGYDTIRRAADRLRASGSPELAEEITTSVFGRHPFDFEVFNAGVMLMNLDRMRKDRFVHTFLPFVQYFGVNGQEVLNIYIGDDYERVDPHWNQLVRLEMWDAPKIAHWAGPRKPWKGIWVTGRAEWQEAERAFAERTAGLLDPASSS